jgi:hypothetical protein
MFVFFKLVLKICYWPTIFLTSIYAFFYWIQIFLAYYWSGLQGNDEFMSQTITRKDLLGATSFIFVALIFKSRGMITEIFGGDKKEDNESK